MITVINGILARQKRGGDARQWLNEIRDGYHYFFDLDLTPEEAKALGWKQTPTTMNP
jgi:hypothetical protein